MSKWGSNLIKVSSNTYIVPSGLNISVSNSILDNFPIRRTYPHLISINDGILESKYLRTSVNNPVSISGSCAYDTVSGLIICIGGWDSTKDTELALRRNNIKIGKFQNETITWIDYIVTDFNYTGPTEYEHSVTDKVDLPIGDASLSIVDNSLLLYGGRSACYHDIDLDDPLTISYLNNYNASFINDSSKDISFSTHINLSTLEEDNVSIPYIHAPGNGLFGHCSVVMNNTLYNILGAEPSYSNKTKSGIAMSLRNTTSNLIEKVTIDKNNSSIFNEYLNSIILSNITLTGLLYPSCTSDGISKIFISGGINPYTRNISNEIWEIIVESDNAIWNVMNISNGFYEPTYRGNIDYINNDNDSFILLYGGLNQTGSSKEQIDAFDLRTGILSAINDNNYLSNKTVDEPYTTPLPGGSKSNSFYIYVIIISIVVIAAIIVFILLACYYRVIKKKKNNLNKDRNTDYNYMSRALNQSILTDSTDITFQSTGMETGSHNNSSDTYVNSNSIRINNYINSTFATEEEDYFNDEWKNHQLNENINIKPDTISQLFEVSIDSLEKNIQDKFSIEGSSNSNQTSYNTFVPPARQVGHKVMLVDIDQNNIEDPLSPELCSSIYYSTSSPIKSIHKSIKDYDKLEIIFNN